jgi:hypothetical protein
MKISPPEIRDFAVTEINPFGVYSQIVTYALESSKTLDIK